MVSRRLSRRHFLRSAAAASGALVAGFDPRARAWITQAHAAGETLDALSKLDGVLLTDDASRAAMAADIRPGNIRVTGRADEVIE